MKTIATVLLVLLGLAPAVADAQAILLQNITRRTITTAAGSPFGTPATLTLEAGTLGFYQGSAFATNTVRNVQWCVGFDALGFGWFAIFENAAAANTTYAGVKSPDPAVGFPDMLTSPSFYCANGK